MPEPAAESSPLDPFGYWSAWRDLVLNGPWSGDVNQAIRTLLAEHLGQLGLVNVSLAATPDAGLEQRIVGQVASYGRQLGWLVEAVDALARAHGGEALDAAGGRALERVSRLREEVDAIKEREAADQVDRVVADVRRLRRDPDRNADALAAVQRALDGD